ncbi:MAG: ferredoxin--NADP reductase [Legionellales bacterium]
MQVITFPITLVDSFMIAPKVKHFVFSCERAPAFHYLPGQFITVHLDHDGKSIKRSYSIANEPKQDNQIEFAAGFVDGGPGSELLFNLKPGDTIQINGPFGRLILKDDVPGRYILVATSTGITPYRAMLKELSLRLEQHPNLRVVILQGVQKREDILYADEFLAFAQTHPRVLFRTCLSRDKECELYDHEYDGYVQHVFPELNLNSEQDVVYLCGNPGMIDDAYSYLQDKSFAVQQIIREKYISR